MTAKRSRMVAVAGLAVLMFAGASAQQPPPRAAIPEPAKPPPLYLRAFIPLPGVYGRMDHFGYDIKRGNLIVSALGNNTVEIINSWKRVHTITGVEHPQGELYVPGVDRIVTSSASGKVRFYDAASFNIVKTLDFGAGSDTDNLRYDPQTKRVFVGEEEGITAIDPVTMERGQQFKLGSHAESFQFETKGTRIFVNLPDQESFGVIDWKTGAIKKWKIPGDKDNHTLAFDEAGHRLFTAGLQPGHLTVVDSDSGKVVANFPCVQEVDDLWFDSARKRIYVPGAGYIDVFQQIDPDHYALIAHIAVGVGAGITSYYRANREGETLYMSWPNMLPQGGSQVAIFSIND